MDVSLDGVAFTTGLMTIRGSQIFGFWEGKTVLHIFG